MSKRKGHHGIFTSTAHDFGDFDFPSVRTMKTTQATKESAASPAVALGASVAAITAAADIKTTSAKDLKRSSSKQSKPSLHNMFRGFASRQQDDGSSDSDDENGDTSVVIDEEDVSSTTTPTTADSTSDSIVEWPGASRIRCRKMLLRAPTPSGPSTTTATNVTSLTPSSSANSIASDTDASLGAKTIFIEKKGGVKLEYFGEINAKSQPHGSGTLKYPNKSQYEGEFENGLRSGLGTISWENGAYAFGMWREGVPDENQPWKISYDGNDSGDLYFGRIKVSGCNKGQDMIDIQTDLMKHGMGEFTISKGEQKYYGNFSLGKRCGYGVLLIISSGERYYGNWKDDLFHGDGCLMYRDGTVFQGTFAQGKRSGHGVLLLPNGDELAGKWNGDKVTDAAYTKGTCQNRDRSTLSLLFEQINEAMRESAFEFVDNITGLGTSASASPSLAGVAPSSKSKSKEPATPQQVDATCKWLNYLEIFRPQWDSQRNDMAKKIQMNGGIKDADSFDATVERFLKDKDCFVHQFVKYFVSAFQFTYATGNRARQNKRKRESAFGKVKAKLYHAIDDIRSFLTCVVDLLLGFFEHTVKMSPQQLKNIYREQLFKHVSEHVHQRVYSNLFPLYEQFYEENDLLISQKIQSLIGECSVSVLGIAEKFLPLPQQEPAAQSGEGTAAAPVAFKASIAKLGELKSANSPCKKLEVLEQMRESVLEEMAKNLESRGKSAADGLGADDITPVLTYLFMQDDAISNHNAQFHYLIDWRMSYTELTSSSVLLSFYEGFLDFVLYLDPNLKRDGILVSSYQIRRDLIMALEDQIDFCKERKEYISFFWLPQLLIHVQLLTATTGISGQGIRFGECVRVPGQAHTGGDCLGSAKIPQTAGSKSLIKNLIKYHKHVKTIFDKAKELGFTVALVPKTTPAPTEQPGQQPVSTLTANNFDVVIQFSVVYPSNVYADLSLDCYKYLKLEQQS